MTIKTGLLALMCASMLAAGCGGGGKSGDGDGGAGGSGGSGDGGSPPGGGDGGGSVVDARIDPNCEPGTTQCTNCMDDDGDGRYDGFDAECSGPLDNDEGSFATGISGDNVDAKKQDCFFDGNSGGACQISTCCLYKDGECPAALGGADFDRTMECMFGPSCIDACAPLTPPGCDCFGCCTVCVDGKPCEDVLAGTEGCTQEGVGTDACPTCVKFDACTGAKCNADPMDCVLCPGEDASNLPSTCSGGNTCPDGQTTCTSTAGCAANQYCQTGCCVASVAVE